LGGANLWDPGLWRQNHTAKVILAPNALKGRFGTLARAPLFGAEKWIIFQCRASIWRSWGWIQAGKKYVRGVKRAAQILTELLPEDQHGTTHFEKCHAISIWRNWQRCKESKVHKVHFDKNCLQYFQFLHAFFFVGEKRTK